MSTEDFTLCESQTSIDLDGFETIDVRSIDEHLLGNIPGSINIDYNSKKFESEIFAFDKDQKIILYCKTNNRSSKAASFLSQNGYSNIFILEEGFKGWFLDQKIKK